jgi:hypothetical protein
MSLKRQGKRVLRAIRTIPVEQIAPVVHSGERDGLWCLVADELTIVPAGGGQTVTVWDDPTEYAQFVRYVEAHPERVHPTQESALAFVRSRIAARDFA